MDLISEYALAPGKSR
jgi:hypothetical protein